MENAMPEMEPDPLKEIRFLMCVIAILLALITVILFVIAYKL